MFTPFDKALLNIIQTDLPISPRPFSVLAERLKTSEATVIERLNHLKEQGFIRRIGPFFDSVKLGYIGTLVAVEAAPEFVKQIAEAINKYPGVTHNYEREGVFNLWFTLLAPDTECQIRILDEVKEFPGVVRLINLPATKKFKVSVQFTLE